MCPHSTQDFQQGEAVTHPSKGSGVIYQDQAGYENAIVVFDNRPGVVVGVRARELTRPREF